MSDIQQPLPNIEPELLLATCSHAGIALSRNSAWINILGEASGLWFNLVEEDQEIAARNFTEAASGSMVTHAVFMAQRSERDLPLPILLHFIPVSIPDSENSTTPRIVVITGEVLAEPASWTENQTSKHRMETLGRMTMGIAHDFNNLLSGILGHVSLAGVDPDASERLLEHLNTIEQAATDGASLVKKIQRYIRKEKQESFEPLDITGLVQDCVILTKPYWYNEPRRQGILIELEITPIELPPVQGSAAELRDVFVNLILNAVQALPEGGKISIDTEHVQSDIVIRVRDSGIGMTPAVRARIFEPLFTTKGGRGSGMGLAVAFGVIQEHEGSIDVESELGIGTTFTLALPIAAKRAQVLEPSQELKESKPVSVLVVDDEKMVRTVIDRLLSLRGHTVLSVESAHVALEKLEAGSFDVVITDQGMPGMSGRELAHKIHDRHAGVPVILLTGDTDLGVDANEIMRVVCKPFQSDDLEAAIQAVT